VIVVKGHAELLQLATALHASGGLADLLNGGQEQADQDGDDGDHHQQLDQGEAGEPASQEEDGHDVSRMWRERIDRAETRSALIRAFSQIELNRMGIVDRTGRHLDGQAI